MTKGRLFHATSYITGDVQPDNDDVTHTGSIDGAWTIKSDGACWGQALRQDIGLLMRVGGKPHDSVRAVDAVQL